MFSSIAFIALLAQVPPEVNPIQWGAPIPNDVDWEILALCLISGAALLTFGVNRVFARWQAKGWVTEKAPFYGEIVALTLVPLLTAYAGYLVWHLGLGFLCGVVGSWASPWVIDWLNKAMQKVMTKNRWWPWGTKKTKI